MTGVLSPGGRAHDFTVALREARGRQPYPGSAWRRWRNQLALDRDFRRVLLADPCSFCGASGGTVDHVIARANGGGALGVCNMAGACESCNVAKDDSDLLGFLLERVAQLGSDATRSGDLDVSPGGDT